ncbi:MAG TPA: Rrf2 family transcriptional regulator, partial [Casimicrobiaceae bacterium]
GYQLGRAADAVAIADIILAVDEPIDATQCRGRENCHDDRRCMTHGLWEGLNAQILAYLRSVSLAALVREQRAKPSDVVVLHDQRGVCQPAAAPNAQT